MLTLRLAFRNTLRQKRRTLLTVLSMLGGLVLAAISIGLAEGSYNNVIRLFTGLKLGHVQVHAADYLDRPSLYKTIDNYLAVGKMIDSLEGTAFWAPRLYSAGLASVGEKTIGVRIIGIDPVREQRATRFDKKVIDGRNFSEEPAPEALLGKGLAAVLTASPGDSVVIVSSAADGSIANDIYEVVGIIESGDELDDRSAFYLQLEVAQELLVLDQRVHEIAVIAEELDDVAGITEQIRERLDGTDLTAAPWQEFAKSFYRAMQVDKRGNYVSLAVIILIVAVGVLNSVLMTVLERTREYGVLRAMGTRPYQILRLVLYEVAAMAIISVVVGTAVSVPVNHLLSIYGIPMPFSYTYGGVEFSRLYCEVNMASVLIPIATVVTAAMLVSAFPAVKAARVAPARAMRTH